LNNLGVGRDKIRVTGNVKFGIELHGETGAADVAGIRRDICGESGDKLWVCGSTHAPEEEMILSAYKKILPDFPGLKLLIAPGILNAAKILPGWFPGMALLPFLFRFSRVMPSLR